MKYYNPVSSFYRESRDGKMKLQLILLSYLSVMECIVDFKMTQDCHNFLYITKPTHGKTQMRVSASCTNALPWGRLVTDTLLTAYLAHYS